MILAEMVFNEEFTTRNFSSSPLSITGLQGDLYDYELVCFFANVSGDSIVDITLNSDTTSNYRNYEMKGLSGTANAAAGDSDTAIELQNLIGSANPNLLMMNITGSSGDERTIDCFYNADGAVLKQSSYWKNTANEVDEITITAASSVTCDAQIILYRTPKAGTQAKWELIKTESWTTQNLSSSPIDLTTDGDLDIEYKLDIDILSASGNYAIGLRLNNDSGTNYTTQRLRNASGGLSANRNANQTSVDVTLFDNSTNRQLYYFNIYAESGEERLVSATVSRTGASSQQTETATWWSNTADNMTTIRIFDTASVTTTGTAKLYRKINPKSTADTLNFETIASEDFSSTDFSAGTTHTIPGDSMKLLKIEGLLSNASGDIEIRMQLNSDTAGNYPEQLLKGDTSTASAAASTRNYIVLAKLQNGDQAEFTHYLYTKSGENRPGLTECSYDENALEKLAQWWLNSADEITTVKIFASSTNAVTGNIKVSRLL